jgi:phage-related protein
MYQNWDITFSFIKNVAESAVIIFSGFGSGVISVFRLVVETAIAIFTGFGTGVIGIFRGVAQFAIAIFTSFGAGVISVFRLVVQTAVAMFNRVLSAGVALKNGLVNIFVGIGQGIQNAIKFAMNRVIGNINAIITQINGIISIARKLPGASGLPNLGKIPALATGTNYIPQDTLAFLHKGEAVVTAKYNPANNSVSSSSIDNSSSHGDTYITINVDKMTPFDIIRQLENELNKKYKRI